MNKYLLISMTVMSLMPVKFLCAAPIITDWGSTGGTTLNKDNVKDRMYLVTANDSLTFTVTVDQAVDYEWQVNKSTGTSINLSTFNWTAPNEKGIWELHLKCWNSSNEEAHMEWVVSTLSTGEAPEIFDYFSDGLLTARTETDPWGNAVKNWSAWNVAPAGNYECSKGYMTSSRSGGSLSPYDIYIPNNIKYGTWKFKVYYIPSASNSAGYAFFLKKDNESDPQSSGILYRSTIEPDSHKYLLWSAGGFPATHRVSSRMDGDAGYSDPNPSAWHEYTLILTPEGWFYEFVDGILGHVWYIENPHAPYSAVSNEVTPQYYERHPIGNDIGFSLAHFRSDTKAFLDNIEIYENKYLFPSQNIFYGNFVDYDKGTKSGYRELIKTPGIIIQGLNRTLAEIAQAINDPLKFTYSPDTKTAISYVNITVGNAYGIGELVLNGETLKFHGTSDGSLMLSLYHGSRLKVINSTIDSDNDYYWKWRITNIGDTTGYPAAWMKTEEGWSGPACAFLGQIEIVGSTINNSANFFISSPFILKIKDSKITALHADSTGIYDYDGYFVWTIRDRKAHWDFKKTFVWEQNFYHVLGFEFNNVIFEIASDSSSQDIVLTQNDELLQKYNLYNLDLSNANIKVMKVIKMFSGATTTCYYRGRTALVNSKWNSVSVADDYSEFLPKYYLDVKTVDEKGTPVQGASVKVINEVDDEHYPAENISEAKWFFNSLTQENAPNYWWQSQNLHPVSNIVAFNYNDGQIRYSENVYMPRWNITAATGADGHTPLPEFPSSDSLVLADYVKARTSQTNFTYTISASKDMQTASISGLDIDDSWYRRDPGMPGKTVVLVFGGQSYVSDSEEKIIKAEGIVIYPNPYVKGNNSESKIYFSNLPQAATIRIYTMSGNLIKTLKHTAPAAGASQEWDISDISSGVYLFVIVSEGKKQTGKISIIK